MRLPIFEVFDEQALVCFTGKLNILEASNNRYVGSIIFHEGEIINAEHRNINGFKALLKLCVISSDEKYSTIVEPELISLSDRMINIPLGNLKRKLTELYDSYKASEKFRPPSNTKLMAKADVVDSKLEITPDEYSVLCTLSDYNLVEDVYSYNEMLDFEITNALVTLRKKEVLKVIKLK